MLSKFSGILAFISAVTYPSSMDSLASGNAEIIPGGRGYAFLGCFTDNVNDRTFPIKVDVRGGVSAINCLDTCRQGNFPFAGIESGNECYCGFGIGGHSVPADIYTCDIPCEANPDQICGGDHHLLVYTGARAA